MAVQQSFPVANGSWDDDGRPKRTGKKIFHYYPLVPFNSFPIQSWNQCLSVTKPGTLWSCVAHIITAVIGSGVLSLAWSTSQLGWIAGPISLLCFAIVTYISAFLLADCYRSPDPITGTRNYSYMDAVRVNLGSIYINSFSSVRSLHDLQL